jgi:hypothetical protein
MNVVNRCCHFIGVDSGIGGLASWGEAASKEAEPVDARPSQSYFARIRIADQAS